MKLSVIKRTFVIFCGQIHSTSPVPFLMLYRYCYREGASKSVTPLAELEVDG